MIKQFVVPDVLQQFLTSIPAVALSNVVWDTNISATAPAIPLNTISVRRMLAFSKIGSSDEATPAQEYNCWLQSLDMSYLAEITFPRAPGM